MDRHRANTSAPSGRYPANRSFVVQLREAGPGGNPGTVSGRIENVATGENAVFDSLQELEQFMRRSSLKQA